MTSSSVETRIHHLMQIKSKGLEPPMVRQLGRIARPAMCN